MVETESKQKTPEQATKDIALNKALQELDRQELDRLAKAEPRRWGQPQRSLFDPLVNVNAPRPAAAPASVPFGPTDMKHGNRLLEVPIHGAVVVVLIYSLVTNLGLKINRTM